MATKKTTKTKATTKKASSKKVSSNTKAAKKTTKSTKTATKSPQVQSDIEAKSTNQNKQENHKRFFIPLVIILIVGLVYFIANQFIIATVNYRPITRYSLLKEMEAQIGQQTLESLIVKQLILQEAQKQGVSVAQEDIDEEIATIEESLSAQGQVLEEALAFQGMTMDDLREQLRLQLLVKQLAGEKEVSDEEIEEFIEQQRAFLQEDADENQIRQDAEEFLKQQKQAEAADELINNLRIQAAVNYFGPFSDTPEAEFPQQ